MQSPKRMELQGRTRKGGRDPGSGHAPGCAWPPSAGEEACGFGHVDFGDRSGINPVFAGLIILRRLDGVAARRTMNIEGGTLVRQVASSIRSAVSPRVLSLT